MYTGTGVNQSQTYRWYLLLYSPAGAYLKPVGCVFFCTRLQVLISNLWVVSSSVLACRCHLYRMLLTLVDVSMRLLFGHLRASLSVMLLLVHANSIHMTSVVTSAGAYV